MNRPSPRSLRDLDPAAIASLDGIFTDIDDTLTWEGRVVPEAFTALAALRAAGLRVVPITGRPGGWVDHIARMWPVDGVVGENGGLWFYMSEGEPTSRGRGVHPPGLVRRFLQPPEERAANRVRLTALGRHILAAVPGSALASDQPYRDLDLAVDFCEDVPPLGEEAIDRIVAEFREAGATCKVSSIHVNGWYGSFDKLEGCRRLVADLWEEDLEARRERWMYFGDSPNDEPMFGFFPLSVGVANVRRFLPRMEAWPRFVTEGSGGHGFAEAAEVILAAR